MNSAVDRQQTRVFNRYGAFFAFSDKQFDEQANPNYVGEYMSLGSGMVVPQQHAAKMMAALDLINATKIKREEATTSKKAIIWYALAKYETQITGDISDAVDSLAGYNITEEEIRAEYSAYFDHCVDNDYF